MSRTTVHTPAKFAYPDAPQRPELKYPKSRNAYKKFLRDPLHVGDKRSDYSVIGVVTAEVAPVRSPFVTNVPNAENRRSLSTGEYVLDSMSNYLAQLRGYYADGETVPLGKQIVRHDIEIDPKKDISLRQELEIAAREALVAHESLTESLQRYSWTMRGVSNVDYVKQIAARSLSETIHFTTVINGETLRVIFLPVAETKVKGQYVPTPHEYGNVTYLLVLNEFEEEEAPPWHYSWYATMPAMFAEDELKMNKHYGPDPDRVWYAGRDAEIDPHIFKQKLNSQVRDISGLDASDLEEIFMDY